MKTAGKVAMDDQVRQLAKQLLKTGFDQLSDRERRVITGVAKRTQISRDANRAFEEKLTLGDRLADRVATFGGSWTFITIFLAVLVAWILFNSVILAWPVAAFDPYPYIFLNLILSMLAALQAPIIMMSQNRQAARDRVAAGLDYEVNLKAELEIMALHEKLDQIRSQHLAEMLRTQQEQLRLLIRVLALDGNAPGAASGSLTESTNPKEPPT
ncbi:cyclic nucleotide-binding protein [Labrys miyagiensis]|uniref:Cyclic nucleotide-binding protein n=2 Tax=Labrys miyagiensis TaxID=346912 RepID=A0ABQ6CPM2_9HYPH|nr:cyclic nucleotide-binding protein [Labrys miyagiensis]